MKKLNVAIIGYEHGHVRAVVDFIKAIESDTKIEPNFYDGMKALQVQRRRLEIGGAGEEGVSGLTSSSRW